jgi:hypothetical protein
MCRFQTVVSPRLAQHQPENPVGKLPERRSQEVACIPPALIEDAFG